MLFYLRNLLGNYVTVDSSITILFYLRNLFDTYDPFDSSITMLFYLCIKLKPEFRSSASNSSYLIFL